MNGAEVVIELAGKLDTTVCFAHPGTTELDFAAAFDAGRTVHPVLGLHENVCTGAADGWARVSGLGLTLLHLGAGLGNGLANLHNARRAGTPIVNIIGDHASWHLPFDPPLASDLVELASAGTLRTDVSSDTNGSTTRSRTRVVGLDPRSRAGRARGSGRRRRAGITDERGILWRALLRAIERIPSRTGRVPAVEFLHRVRRARRPALDSRLSSSFEG